MNTVFFYQRGSSESKKPGETEAVDRDPRLAREKPDAPWPVRRGGWLLKLYENSLSLAFLLLFLVSFLCTREFLSLVAMVVLSIYLRQRGSPESKPVAAAHRETGSE